MKILLLLLCLSSSSFANYAQSPLSNAKLQDFAVLQEAGNESTFTQSLPKSKDLIIVPAYFSCTSSCPLLAENLRNAFSAAKNKADAAVVFLSFNSQDSTSSIKMFREHHKLPSDWTMLVAKSEGDAKNFLAQFDYQFQKTTDGFDHPNSAFIFSGKKQLWTGMLLGIDQTSADIDQAIGEANYADLDGFTQKIVQVISKPQYLIVIGLFGVALPILLILYILFRKTKRESELAV